MKRLSCVLALSFCSLVPARGQVKEIDRTKLPTEAAVQQTYDDLLPIDQFARSYEQPWRFRVTKLEVASRIQADLAVLTTAQKKSPNNKELQLFTGLAAHLAYNVDIETAYEPAVALLKPLANADFRAAWFLGMHRCQSNDPLGGMQMLLKVEASSEKLTRGFWQDYASCSSVANMPVHTLRAYDNARRAGDGSSVDSQMEQIARNRIEPSDPAKTYPAKEAWSAGQNGDAVRFDGTICGESFVTEPTAHINVADVKNGTCTITIETDPYPNRHGVSTATLLLLTQTAAAGETLDQYSQRLLNDPRYAGRTPIRNYCPVSDCLGYEIVTDKLYGTEGGAHLLALFFRSEQPDYPGLRFEEPQGLPEQPSSSKEPTFYRPGKTLRRFDGTLFTFVALDANQDIYPRARADFDALIKSLVVDTK